MPTSQHLRTAAAKHQAHAALAESVDGGIGNHCGIIQHDAHTATHLFTAHVPGYQGWQWHVVVACAQGSRSITINEITLMPGKTALRAPKWVPWVERVQPGDLRPGYVMPPPPNDLRLDDAPHGKTLSTHGLGTALRRWSSGDYGPDSAFTEKDDDHCSTCAFYLPMELPADDAGFGACVNEYSADGRIVHSHYGCGAHSNTAPAEPLNPPATQPYDDWGY